MDITPIKALIDKNSAENRRPFEPPYRAGAAFSGGKYMSAYEATVPLLDSAVQGADGCYESLSVYQGNIFRLDDHLNRFKKSSETFHLNNPYSNDELLEIISTMVKLTGLQDAYVWLCLTRGFPEEGDEVVRNRTSKKNHKL